jgi:hypothetical protein
VSRELPKVHLIAKNRLTQYMGAASAYSAVLGAIDHDIAQLLRTNPEIFDFADPAAGFVEVRDFQTTGAVAFAKGQPFSRLTTGRQSVNGQRVDIKAEYLEYARRAMAGLVAKLRLWLVFMARLHRNRTKHNGLQRVNAGKPLICMVAWGGIEPPTRGFSIRCSTN